MTKRKEIRFEGSKEFLSELEEKKNQNWFVGNILWRAMPLNTPFGLVIPLL
jgi:hypothetical protein